MRGLVTPGPLLAMAVRRLVDREGSIRTAALLGVSLPSLTRLRGRVPVRAGTIALVARALEQLDPTMDAEVHP